MINHQTVKDKMKSFTEAQMKLMTKKELINQIQENEKIIKSLSSLTLKVQNIIDECEKDNEEQNSKEEKLN